jgi:hypothetical protein
MVMVPLIGAVLVVVSGFSFWYLLPKDGKVHWLVGLPGVDAYLPVVITNSFALGLVMMLSALTG